MSIEKVREEFEAWVLREYPNQHMGRFATGEYHSTVIEHCWQAWQASRAAQERSATSQEVQALLSQFDADEVEEVRAAEEFIRESGRCSISALQRKFLIGYNRACRLMDKLVALKVVSPIDAEGRRTVLPEQVKS